MTSISNNFDERWRVNIDISNRCPLECHSCSRQVWYRNKGLKVPGKDMSLEAFNKIISHYKQVNFCGQVSDPIHHPKLITFLNIMKEKNIMAVIHTASGYKSKEWFIKAFKTNPDARWLFGIDGVPEVSHTYRINQDGVKLFDIMLEAKKYLNKRPVWQYILMDFNLKYLDEAMKLATKHNLEFKQIIDRKNLSEGGYIEQFKT
tara:strand:- start:274 stop:885 length:612 start_codon:yes stop_codon:yes gene_type:complete